MPSAMVAALLVAKTLPAAKDSAYAGASVETTPTTLVEGLSASRMAITPQMPEPSPIGT